jgi:hypothetical protein
MNNLLKGKLTKIESEWVVRYDVFQKDYNYLLPAYNFLQLHPDDVKQINEDAKVFDNIEARIAAYPEVCFEIISYDGTTKIFEGWNGYAKLIHVVNSNTNIDQTFLMKDKDGIFYELNETPKINTWDDIFDNIESEMDCVVPLKVANYLEKHYRKPTSLQTDENGKPLTYWGGVDFTNPNAHLIKSNSTTSSPTETLYTEEQIIDFLKLRLMFFGIPTTDSENKKWFKQFKKK